MLGGGGSVGVNKSTLEQATMIWWLGKYIDMVSGLIHNVQREWAMFLVMYWGLATGMLSKKQCRRCL